MLDDRLVTSVIRSPIGQVRQLCTTAPKLCDKVYDVNKKRGMLP